MAFASAQPACSEPMSGIETQAAEALANTQEPVQEKSVIYNWALRPVVENDALLRQSFLDVLEESNAVPPHEKLIMYDACDESEVRAPVGNVFRKRLDARRNTKPKKPDAQRLVCTPFDANGFHFGKIRRPRFIFRFIKIVFRIIIPSYVGKRLIWRQIIHIVMSLCIKFQII